MSSARCHLWLNRVHVARSLSSNMLCGVHDDGDGVYTTEGITALCEGLKGCAVTSLE